MAAKIDDVFTIFISHKQDDHALAVEVKKALDPTPVARFTLIPSSLRVVTWWVLPP